MPKLGKNREIAEGQADYVQNLKFTADSAELAKHGFAVELSSGFLLLQALGTQNACQKFPLECEKQLSQNPR